MKVSSHQPSSSDAQLLRISEVSKLTTLSKSCIQLWVAQGRFPKPLTISATVKVWRLSQVKDWITSIEAEAAALNPMKKPPALDTQKASETQITALIISAFSRVVNIPPTTNMASSLQAIKFKSFWTAASLHG